MSGPGLALRVESLRAVMSDLGMNKVFGAVLATGLVILGLRQVTEMAFTQPELKKIGRASCRERVSCCV